MPVLTQTGPRYRRYHIFALFMGFAVVFLSTCAAWLSGTDCQCVFGSGLWRPDSVGCKGCLRHLLALLGAITIGNSTIFAFMR
ncbi:hypothetical protein EDB81DRAFT_787773 [Dactylonectria macrodidyma]|uniref:Uncharacterized protein n=1 Tax=Dactylonectria macrodidyma TaxID=307937 RepID=A0A9P9JDN6_9HYPO|nr:hypothetical protein EDB81DRAFT_787773 [Dactylonectria macrodidyma]